MLFATDLSLYVINLSVCFFWLLPTAVTSSINKHEYPTVYRITYFNLFFLHVVCVASLQMPEFEKSTIHIRDPERVEQIICSLIKGGATKLQVQTQLNSLLTLQLFEIFWEWQMGHSMSAQAEVAGSNVVFLQEQDQHP